MEIMTLEFGVERVWSDNDALSRDGYKETPYDKALFGQGVIPGKNVTIGSCFERAWSDADALPSMQSPILKKAA